MVVIVVWCSHVDTPTGFAHPLGSTRPPTYTRPRGRSGVKFPHICTPGRFFYPSGRSVYPSGRSLFPTVYVSIRLQVYVYDSYTFALPQGLPTGCTRRVYTPKEIQKSNLIYRNSCGLKSLKTFTSAGLGQFRGIICGDVKASYLMSSWKLGN